MKRIRIFTTSLIKEDMLRVMNIVRGNGIYIRENDSSGRETFFVYEQVVTQEVTSREKIEIKQSELEYNNYWKSAQHLNRVG